MVGLLALVACGDDGGESPVLPADYADSYLEVRDCRRSGDHDLNYIRVLVEPAAKGTYDDRDQPFAEGTIIVKEEYDFADDECSGDIQQWTLMVKGGADRPAETLGWHWYRYDRDRLLLGEDTPACFGCHTGCTDVGHDGTCAEP